MTSISIVAHRGDSEAERENTLAAINSSLQNGADIIEIDIRTTRDQVSVVIHDSTTLRLWGHPRTVAEQTLAEIQKLGVADCRIPTLEEVAELMAGAERPVKLLVDTVDVADAKVAWQTLRTNPHVKSGAVEIAWCGLAAAMTAIRDLDDDAEVMHNHLGGELDVERLTTLKPSTINVEWTLLNAELVEQIHHHRFGCNAWTVNDAETMSWLIDQGVDSITTNRIRTLAGLLKGGHSPLALAWASAAELAARCGIDDEYARALMLARQISEWTIGYTRTATLGDVETKAHGADIVTEVDTSVESHIRGMIEAEFPDHLIVGEEFGGEAEAGRPTWYLDPVDGTTNLANSTPWTSMSLALAIDDQPLVATVAQPWLGDIFLAGRGLGAVLNGVPLQVKKATTLTGRSVMTEWAAHVPWPGMRSFLSDLGDAECTPRIMGSGTLTMAQVAAGSGVAGLVHRFHPIDHLAGVLIAAEAGCRVINGDGSDSLFPADGMMLVAVPGAAELLWPMLERAQELAQREAEQEPS